jgi:hypothetical protein
MAHSASGRPEECHEVAENEQAIIQSFSHLLINLIVPDSICWHLSGMWLALACIPAFPGVFCARA